MSAAAEAESGLLQRVLQVCLHPRVASASQDGSLPCIYLKGVAQELEMDGMQDTDPGAAAGSAAAGAAAPLLLLSKDLLDRVLVARLIEEAPEAHPQQPLHYLLGVYARTLDEARSRAVAEHSLMPTLQAVRDLVVNYAGLVLMGGVVPQSEAAEERGSLQLVDSLEARFNPSAGAAGVVPMPLGFMEDLAAKFVADQNEDGLQELMRPIAKELARRAKAVSALGDYITPLASMRFVVGIEPIARVLVAAREWLPDLKSLTGRGIEAPGSSWLGPCFCPSSIDDAVINSQPNVGAQCFHDLQKRRPSDLRSSMDTLSLATKQIQTELHTIVKALLGKGTRDAMVDWLAAVMEGNMERAKMQLDLTRAASHGFFINHNAVMLKLAGPFLDPSSPVFWKRVDVRYVACNPRIDFGPETKLTASTQEDAAWRERVASSAGASTSGDGAPPSLSTSKGPIDYHFICECFFMTFKSLHLGVVKMMDELKTLSERVRRNQPQVEDFEEQIAGLPPGSIQQTLSRQQLEPVKRELHFMQGNMMSMSGVLQDEGFMTEVLAFYRLAASWLLSIACPSCRGNAAAVSLPLVGPAPPEFASLPEWFVEDIVDVLVMLSSMPSTPQYLTTAKLDEVMMMMMAFMDGPTYVRSSHVRAKMAELLHLWLPQEEGAPSRMGRFSSSRGGVSSSLSYLFTCHPMVQKHLAPSLIKLYVDVEVMDTASAFYEKFYYRQLIGEILAHLWEQPPHREAWVQFAAREGTGTQAYVRFANMLITDATFLLDESLKKLEDLKQKEQLMADPVAWAAVPARERREAESSAQQSGGQVKSLLMYAQVTGYLMNFSTEKVSSTFLLPGMVQRTAAMLDYFLKYLTGPERRKLAIKDSEKYNFRPRELLLNIMQIFLHLSAADRGGGFAQAIAMDTRSYSPSMFPEAAKVLTSAQMLSPPEMAQLDILARAAIDARMVIEEQENLMEGVEVPEEFQDPLINEIMSDPVRLPTSGNIMDREQIIRHLLTDQRDPMNRQPLMPDMLEPQPELKKRIKDWIAATVAAKRKAQEGAGQ